MFMRCKPCAFGCGIIIALVASVWGCSKSQPASAPTAKTTVATTQDVGAPVTQAEAEQFATDLEIAIRDADEQAICKLVDGSAIIDAAIRDIPGGEEFAKFVTKDRETSDSLFGSLIIQQNPDGLVQALKVRMVNGRQQVLCRRLDLKGNFASVDFILARHSSGKARATDMFVIETASFASRNFRPRYVALAALYEPEIVDRLAGHDREIAKNCGSFLETLHLMEDDGIRQANANWQQLPPAIRTDRSLLFMRQRLAKGLGNAEYLNALSDFRDTFANPHDADVASVTYWILKKDYAKSEECVDRIDKAVGGDPYLEVIRCRLRLAANDVDGAEAAADRAIAADPNMEDGYWVRITVSLWQKRYADTVKFLRILDDRFQMQFDDLTKLPEYAEFVKSPEYTEWLKTQHTGEKEPK